jgi:hypothetical protein
MITLSGFRWISKYYSISFSDMFRLRTFPQQPTSTTSSSPPRRSWNPTWPCPGEPQEIRCGHPGMGGQLPRVTPTPTSPGVSHRTLPRQQLLQHSLLHLETLPKWQNFATSVVIPSLCQTSDFAASVASRDCTAERLLGYLPTDFHPDCQLTFILIVIRI